MPIVVISNEKQFRRDLEKQGFRSRKELMDALNDIARKIRDVAVERAPLGHTGRLKATGVGLELVKPDSTRTFRGAVGLTRTPHYGIYVHEGTGLYGNKHRFITPGKGNVMAWTGDFGRVFSRRTEGQHPQPFVREALAIVERTYAAARIAKLGYDVGRLDSHGVELEE